VEFSAITNDFLVTFKVSQLLLYKLNIHYRLNSLPCDKMLLWNTVAY